MMPKILFDLDGTLIDSRIRLFKLFDHLVAQNLFSFEEYWEMKRNMLAHSEILQKHFHWNKERISWFQTEWMNLIEHDDYLCYDQPFEGTLQILAQLKKEHELYLFTARQSEAQTIKQLSSLNLSKFFSNVFITGQKVNKYDLVLNASISVSSSDSVVGDTGVDVELGKNLGCITVAVCSGFRSPEILKSYGPDHIFKGITDPLFKNHFRIV
jgi:phosphoglycolate phosphatase